MSFLIECAICFLAIEKTANLSSSVCVYGCTCEGQATVVIVKHVKKLTFKNI